MTAAERMEEVWRSNPDVGRGKLKKAAGVSLAMAQRFIDWKKGKRANCPGRESQAKAEKAAPPDKYAFLDQLPQHELDIIRKSITAAPAKHTPTPVSWGSSSFKFAAIADTHIGHQFSHRAWWDKACSLVERERCDFALHAGDITEGMSGRPGHCYELQHIGMDAQVKEAVARLKQLPVPVKAITGNHDLWAYKSVGADPGSMIAACLPDRFEYLGMDEADVEVQGVKIKLWHGGDGSSYATSYRTQKFVEGLSGGEKPHILLSGHAHKSIFHECRNVMVFEGGTLCGQTGWMRGKKLAAHCGFWIVEVWPNEAGIERIKPEWVPFFG